MIDIHPKFVELEGKEALVVLTLKEFQAMQDALEDAEDLRILQESRQAQKDAPTISHEQLRKELGLDDELR